MAKNTTKIIISWIYGILGLIILIFLINLLAYFVSTPLTRDLVGFINGNIILLIIISFLFFLGSLFYYIGFPGSLAYPIFDAFGGAFLVFFLINLIVLIDKYLVTGIGNVLSAYSLLFSSIIFIIILIFGYISVFQNTLHEPRHNSRHEEIIEETEETEEPAQHSDLRRKVTRRTRRRI